MEPGLNRKLDYSDYRAAPEDGKRYEILDGGLLVTPAPSPRHQWASKRLERQLEDFFEPRGLGKVFNAPIDLILGPHDVFQPDLVVAREEQIGERGIEGAPLLVVEVLSPSTADRDRGIKAERYGQLGVPHYWLLDPDARTLECRRLHDGVYHEVLRADAHERVRHPDWPGLELDLSAVWG